MDARGLLDIAAEYVEARRVVELARQVAVTPTVDLDEIAGRWEAGLREYLAR